MNTILQPPAAASIPAFGSIMTSVRPDPASRFGKAVFNVGPAADEVMFGGKSDKSKKKSKKNANKTEKSGKKGGPDKARGDVKMAIAPRVKIPKVKGLSGSKADEVTLVTGAKVSKARSEDARLGMRMLLSSYEDIQLALDEMIDVAREGDAYPFELEDTSIEILMQLGILDSRGKMDEEMREIVKASFDPDAFQDELDEIKRGFGVDDDELDDFDDEPDFMFVEDPYRQRDPKDSDSTLVYTSEAPKPSKHDWRELLAGSNPITAELVERLEGKGKPGLAALHAMHLMGLNGDAAANAFQLVANGKVSKFIAAVEAQDAVLLALAQRQSDSSL